MAQICFGLRGCFSNFTLKIYPNRFGSSKTCLDGRDGARHHVAGAHSALKNFSIPRDTLSVPIYLSNCRNSCLSKIYLYLTFYNFL
ncbi:hypothetical protein RHMOL_Rhmol04G0119300 [Rhododendron molle]|uniref:Uncharacterized protein n=1 Tax=Rhododendron molle TaxID=49168 RepID=A0ACC0NZA9_RHOML|nr:hypothetical protein RHMOL_Rhmol04G0119300 [Rhododendron molle]